MKTVEIKAKPAPIKSILIGAGAAVASILVVIAIFGISTLIFQ